MKMFFTKHTLGFAGIACLLLSGVVGIIQLQFGMISSILAIAGLAGGLAYILLDFKNIPAKLSKRSVKYGANTTVMILIVLGIVVLVEAISSRHSLRFDLTKDQRHTLSAQTKSVLTSLEQDVAILVFFGLAQEEREFFEDLLQRYTQQSSKISYEFIDPDQNPGRARSYGIGASASGTIVLETAENQKHIFEASEEALTNAIVQVTREGKKRLYFLAGHGEHSLEELKENGYSYVKQFLENEIFEVLELHLTQQQTVPEDAEVLVIGGPQKNLLPEELEALRAYLWQGGSVLLMLDPETGQACLPFLQEYGVLLQGDIVIDPIIRAFGADYFMPIVSEYSSHTITQDFTLDTIFPMARSVRLKDSLPEGISGQTLFSSSQESWAETSQEEIQSGQVRLNEDQNDLKGPVPVGAALTMTLESENGDTGPAPGRLVVLGDSDFISNTYLGALGNKDLFLNTVSWLAEEEDLVAIRPKDPEFSPLMLTAGQGRLVFFLCFLFLPLFAAMTGVFVLMQRRAMTR